MKRASLGSYAIELKDNLLLVDAHGPFDEVKTKQYVDNMYQVCEEFQGQIWGSLVTFYGNSIFMPEAESALIEMTKFRVQAGMVANASVILESNTADLQQMQLRRIYQHTDITFHVFSDINSAETWLTTYMEQENARQSIAM